MLQTKKELYTLEEYFALEDQSEEKHEYFYGELFAMAGGTPNHNRITMDLAGVLNAALRERECEVFASDLLSKEDDGSRRLREYNSLDDALYIQALQCRLFLKDVYQRVTPLPVFHLVRPEESDGEERDNA